MAYRVVIAEDFRMIREIFENAVKQSEDYVLAGSFATAVQAVEYVRNNPADLILMDVCMPVMDGLETTAKIRELDNASLARIPIIAMTANAFETDVEAALGAGMNAHIAKPFKKEDLIATISAYIPE